MIPIPARRGRAVPQRVVRRAAQRVARCSAVLALAVCAPLAALDGADPRFDAAVEDNRHPAVAATDEPLLLRWDLRTARQVLYALEQSEVEVTTQRLHGRTRSLERDSEAAGTMIVEAESARADVRIEELTMQTTVSANGRSESASARLPSLVAIGLSEAGTVRGAEGAAAPSSIDNLASGLFLLPARALRPGESDQVRVRLGAAIQWGQDRAAMTTFPIVVSGDAQVTLTRFERLALCECARLDITFDAANEDSPRDFPGAARIAFHGRARTWFDPATQRLVEGTLAMQLGIELDAPDQSRGDTGLTVVTDTFTRVRLGR